MVPFCLLFAESEGFKPPIPGKGIPDFESSAFGHSANPPCYLILCPSALQFYLLSMLLNRNFHCTARQMDCRIQRYNKSCNYTAYAVLFYLFKGYRFSCCRR